MVNVLFVSFAFDVLGDLVKTRLTMKNVIDAARVDAHFALVDARAEAETREPWGDENTEAQTLMADFLLR